MFLFQAPSSNPLERLAYLTQSSSFLVEASKEPTASIYMDLVNAFRVILNRVIPGSKHLVS